MADTNKQEMSNMDKNIAAQEKLAGTDINLIDASDKLKENKNPIDPDTATNSPTKGMLDIADEIVSEADYTPSSKQSEKIAKKAKKKLQEKSGLADDQFNETLNYQPLEEPENYALVNAAKARLARSAAWDNSKEADPHNDPEYIKAKKLETEALSKISRAPNSMDEKEAKEVLDKYQSKEIDDYQAKIDRYNAIETKKNETMAHLREQLEAQLNKIIDDDTKSWAERKKLMDKTGLLFSHVMQNLGTMMHNAVNPTDWITASDPITLRAAQNLANTIKNRQTNNDTYIDSQVEYWKNVLPAYYDIAKIKQRLGNSRILNIYKRLDAAGQKIIMSLAATDAWTAISENSIIAFMDKLQNGEFASPEQMWTNLVMSFIFSNDENKKVVKDQIFAMAPDSLKDFINNLFDNLDAKKKLTDVGNQIVSDTKADIKDGSRDLGRIDNNVQDLVSGETDEYKKGKTEYQTYRQKLIDSLDD